jgi:hypothetical protein
MSDLKVFHNDFDWVIAKDQEDIAKVLKEHYGYEQEDYILEDFHELDLDTEFTMMFVDNGPDDRPQEGSYPEEAEVYYGDDEDAWKCWRAKATYRQWAETLGRTFLGSTEW